LFVTQNRLYVVGATNSCIGSMQALYGKPSVDHACNVNNEMQVSGKDKATSLPDILLVDFNPCEVSLKTLLLLLIFHIFVKSALSGENQEKMSPSPSVRLSVCLVATTVSIVQRTVHIG